jgi:hypothetical protein
MTRISARRLTLSIMLSITLAIAGGLAAQASPAAARASGPAGGDRLQHQAIRITGSPPVIDGRLDDEVWRGRPAATGFIQMRPNPGQPETERTEAWIAYDDRNVYVAMRMYDSDAGGIAAQLTRRDASGIYSDWAHVLIDSYDDRRTAFRFAVNPMGVQKDVLHFDDTSEDVNWDAVWEVATLQDSLGWTAEFRIPLSQLRYSTEARGSQRWGINFGREIARRGEWSWWSPSLPTVGGMVSQAGTLTGLESLPEVRRLEILPYTVARVTRAPAAPGNPLFRANDPGWNFGGDIRYGVTSNLTLSGTVNPDFGQVEADPSQVNLTAFETFFAEKRPFFVEGGNIFAFRVGTDDNSGESFFYSRRIGRVPQRNVSVQDGWVERPEATRILGAAKLSGKTAAGWTLGFLNAVTAAEHSRIATPGDGVSRVPVEPLANYSVASLTRDFRQGQSAFGGMFTAAYRHLDGEPAFDFLRSSAFSGGLNTRHQFAGRTWEASGFLGGSHIRGSETAISRVQRGPGHYFQRPDAEHLEFDPTRTSLSGAIANLSVFKMGGSKIRGGFGAHLRTPRLELNDLGFQNDADQALGYISVRYQQYEPQWIFRSWTIGLNPSAGYTTGGERTWTQVGNFANFELKNFWRGGWWTGRRFAATDVVALRGGPAVHRPGGQRWNVWLEGDRRKPVNLNVETWGGIELDTGGRDLGVGARVTVRPTPQVNLSLNPSVNRNRNPWQYVATRDSPEGAHYVLGGLDQTTFSVTTRFDYTLSPALSFQLYAQPFVSAGNYATFLEVRDPRANRFAERFGTLQEGQIRYDADRNTYLVDRDLDGRVDFDFRNPDFNFRQLRSNAVLRWEYAPGSSLYLVWSQGRTGFDIDGTFDFRRDFDLLRQTESTNVLLVKVSYWFNP